jgi:hypothetical protein
VDGSALDEVEDLEESAVVGGDRFQGVSMSRISPREVDI